MTNTQTIGGNHLHQSHKLRKIKTEKYGPNFEIYLQRFLNWQEKDRPRQKYILYLYEL